MERFLERSFATAPALLGPIGLSSAWPGQDIAGGNPDGVGVAGHGQTSSEHPGPQHSGSVYSGSVHSGSGTSGPSGSLAESKSDAAVGPGTSDSIWHGPPDTGPLRFPFPLELPDTVGRSWPLRSKKRSL
jgi:hypothetical protein